MQSRLSRASSIIATEVSASRFTRLKVAKDLEYFKKAMALKGRAFSRWPNGSTYIR